MKSFGSLLAISTVRREKLIIYFLLLVTWVVEAASSDALRFNTVL